MEISVCYDGQSASLHRHRLYFRTVFKFFYASLHRQGFQLKINDNNNNINQDSRSKEDPTLACGMSWPSKQAKDRQMTACDANTKG